MKLFIKTLLIINSLAFLFGCECYPVRKGVIVDDLTHMPIANAQIQFGTSKTLSNINGQFEISSSGCDLKMIVIKDKYKPFAFNMSSKNKKTTIELDNEIKYKDLDKPKYLSSDSSSYLISKSYNNNSVHFEYMGTSDSIKIYLEKF